jgi:hypothetical protein
MRAEKKLKPSSLRMLADHKAGSNEDHSLFII